MAHHKHLWANKECHPGEDPVGITDSLRLEKASKVIRSYL